MISFLEGYIMSGKNQETQYKISNIQIKDGLISWENHTVRSSGISQVWLGELTVKPFPAELFLILLFIALAGTHVVCMLIALAASAAVWLLYHRTGGAEKMVHMKLLDGDVISFSAHDEDSIAEFYEAVKSLTEDGTALEILFDENGKAVKSSEEDAAKDTTQAKVKTVNRSAASGPLTQELQVLYENYTKKEDTDNEILAFLEELIGLTESGERSSLTAAYKKFVTLGLISDCNELGLDKIIQEIKASIYQ